MTNKCKFINYGANKVQIVTNIRITFGDGGKTFFKRHDPSARPIDINLGQSSRCISGGWGGGNRGHHNLCLRTTSTKKARNT